MSRPPENDAQLRRARGRALGKDHLTGQADARLGHHDYVRHVGGNCQRHLGELRATVHVGQPGRQAGAHKHPILARFDAGQSEAALVIGMKLPVAEHAESAFAHQQGIGRCRCSLRIEQDPDSCSRRARWSVMSIRSRPAPPAGLAGPRTRSVTTDEGHDERFQPLLDREGGKGAASNGRRRSRRRALRRDDIGASLEAVDAIPPRSSVSDATAVTRTAASLPGVSRAANTGMRDSGSPASSWTRPSIASDRGSAMSTPRTSAPPAIVIGLPGSLPRAAP